MFSSHNLTSVIFYALFVVATMLCNKAVFICRVELRRDVCSLENESLSSCLVVRVRACFMFYLHLDLASSVAVCHLINPVNGVISVHGLTVYIMNWFQQILGSISLMISAC